MTNSDKKKVLTITISEVSCSELPYMLTEADKTLDNTYDILNKKKYFYRSQMRMNTFELISYRVENEEFDVIQFVISDTTDLFNNKSRWIKILQKLKKTLNNAYFIIPGKTCKAKSILAHLLNTEDETDIESDDDKRVIEVKNEGRQHELQSAIIYATEEEYEKKAHTSLTSDFETFIKTVKEHRENGA